jgi:mRNA m6A methyltransferase catalytic subunit
MLDGDEITKKTL